MLESHAILTADVAAFPDRPEEWVDRDSRRIWRQDQIKHEYWNQQAPAFKQSKNRAWVLKACYWQWQMSSRSDFLPVSHKDPAGKAVHSQLCPLIMLWLCCAMLRCAMLCYGMLCYAVLCYAVLCCAVLCYAVLCYCAMLCYAMLCYAMLCYPMLCYTML